MLRKFIVSVSVVLLAGCTSYWEKPTGESPAWDWDDCSYKAEKAFPVSNQVVYKTERKYDKIKCNKKDKDCHGGYINKDYTQLSHDIEDVNEDSRNDHAEHCMRSRGWQQKSRYIWEN